MARTRSTNLQDEEVATEGIIPDDDPFFALSGIIASGDPGWSDRHDELIAQALMNDHAQPSSRTLNPEGTSGGEDVLSKNVPTFDPWEGFLTTLKHEAGGQEEGE